MSNDTMHSKLGLQRRASRGENDHNFQGKVVVVEHPLVQHKLTIMRNRKTITADFRRAASEIAKLMAYEVTLDYSIKLEEIETPIAKMQAPMIEESQFCFISVLRAGNGMLEGFLDLLPGAHVGHIGLYRDPKTHAAIQYYCKLPTAVSDQHVIIVDPMLATGHSAVAALDLVAQRSPQSIKYVCILSTLDGIEVVHSHHPTVTLFTAAIDPKLNEHKYIVPGLGDAGDRMFGTV